MKEAKKLSSVERHLMYERRELNKINNQYNKLAEEAKKIKLYNKNINFRDLTVEEMSNIEEHKVLLKKLDNIYNR